MDQIFFEARSMVSVMLDWRHATYILLPLICLSTYFIVLAQGILTVRNKKDGSLPPTVPYAIPFLRHLPAFIRDRERFLGKAIVRYGAYVPVRIHILNRSMTLLSGAKHISTLFRNSRDLNNDHWQVQILVNAFGLPQEDGDVLLKDDTGINAQPHPNSTMTVAEHRIFYLHHHTFATCLTGSSLDALAKQLVQTLSDQFSNCDIGYDTWTELPDIYTSFIRKKVFHAAITALCGTHILEIIPTLDEDFWAFDHAMPDLFQEMPRFLVPDAYRSRDRMKQNIMKWHDFANRHYDVTRAEEDEQEWEEFFGSRVMRIRQKIFHRTPLTPEGYAADDLGMIWGANGNAIPAAGWCILEVIKRPDLHRRVLDEISDSITITHDGTESKLSIDIPHLCSQPYLQSIYAETLRLRTGIVLSRVPTSDLTIDGWRFKKDEPIMASSWFSGRDASVWNTGSPDHPHPVSEFWPERFLVYPNDPDSGPIRRSGTTSTTTSQGPKQVEKQDHTQHDQSPPNPKFSLSNTTGSWIPYGGGVKICPGRHFAKQEIIVVMALFLTMFEVEVLMTEEELQNAMKPDQRFFMFGVMPPAGKIRARMRRKRL
ncbi:hypothetical protein DTO212C5_8537 [Paecilomyces variotii]|nr:hypothetical protein DTO212C5_8537 [Paecilomyces variotii]